MSIDEVSLSKGKLYNLITNKSGKGKKKMLVTSIKVSLSKDIINVLAKLPLQGGKGVKEKTLDMAKNMESAVKNCYPKAKLVADRFRMVKLAIDTL